MTEKNPPIPENSEIFRHHDKRGDQVFLPTFSFPPHHGDWVSLALIDNDSAWRRWIALMAIDEIREEIVEAAHKEFPEGVIEREDMAESEIGAFQEWETKKDRDVFAWRAWGQR